MPHRPQKQSWDSLIDENLKKVFEEDANADLPPHLLELLDRLDKIQVTDGADGSAPLPEAEG